MDFAALARSIGKEAPDNFRNSAAGVVGHANPSTLLDNTTGRVAKSARDVAATVVTLMRCAGGRGLHQPQKCATRREGEANAWQTFDAGLLAVQARLVRSAVHSQVFQDQLLLALCHEDYLDCEETGAGIGGPGESTTAAVPLALFWRLHESGLLPFSRLLETGEAFPSPLALGKRCGGEGQRRFCGDAGEGYMDAIVHGMRALAMQSAREARDADSPEGNAASLVSDIAKHLFDLAYRKLPIGSVGLATGRDETLSSRAARIVLDQLCCGPEVFGTHGRGQGTEARLRGCFSTLAAIAPVVALVVSVEPNSVADSQRSTAVPVGMAASTIARDGGVSGDESAAAFLNRQLRLLMENSSGQSAHVQGEDAGIFETETSAADGSISGLLTDILRHFSSSEFIEILRSICRRAVTRAADTAGMNLHKPLLRWETLGPVVRAAATAHPQEVPAAVAFIGTELAGAAVNFIPSGDGNVSRMTGCNQQQGMLVLSAALQLVAQADVCLQGARRRTGEGGLYAQWVRSCFGPQRGDGCAAQEVGQVEDRPSPQGHGQEKWMPEPHAGGSRLSGLEALREAMEKQRATEILMEALSMSVPYDPAFVLEVHKDVLKMRLREKFSVQVRDFIDLVATRLSDLKSQEKAKRCKRGDTSRDRAMGVKGPMDGETNHLGGDCGDPTVREVGFFLRQFKQTGEVPLALKTAILWRPKSWASFRKVLLAPPAQRIAMPDESGKMRLAGRDLVKETIGRGENGLRVEVSLKYRRLLVQKLAKESLLSAKDHDVFRKSYVEYLQGQRDHDDDKSESPNSAEAVTAIARQFLLLESRLGQRQDNQIEGGRTIEERLALLLQEYLPRALCVELCMEDETKGPLHGQDWFARAVHLLTQILEEWKQYCHAGGSSPGVRRALPQELAEAILNSVHCCVAAVGASLLLPPQPSQDSPGSGKPGSTKRKPDWGRDMETQGCHLGKSSHKDELPGLLGLPAAQAFQRIGEVVTIAAGVEPLGEAIYHRCFSLLVDPNSLDPKQVLSLCHILAALTPAFHLKVRGFLANLVSKIIPPAPTNCAASPEVAGLASTAQVGALYLQSTLLLHEHVWESAAESLDGAGPEHYNSRWRAPGGRRTLGPSSGDGGSSKTPSCLEKTAMGFAPSVLLEFCWWVERRLSIVEQSARSEGRVGSNLTVEIVGLLRLLRSVLKHALIKRALNRAFGIRGSTMPPLGHLVSFEMAVLNENEFGGASTRLALLESVTLGRLVIDPTDNTEGLHNVTDEILVRPKGKVGASSVEEIWKECAACLFGNPSLRDAALRRVCRGSTPHEFDSGGGVGVEQAVHAWEWYPHPSWRSGDSTLTGDSEAVHGLLDSILQVMCKLCNLEATAGSMYEKGSPQPVVGESDNALELGKHSSRRKASFLLTQALALLTRLRVDVAGPALVLVAEITIPAIGATEGRGKAMASLRFMWKEWLCKVRPLEYGAIVSLMRIALMWCREPRDTKQGVGEHEDCPVVRMLEDLPLLAAEIARVWPRLCVTLQPIIGSPSSTGPYARGGWASHLNNLHCVGENLVRDLTGGGWASSTSDSFAGKTVMSSPARPTTNKPSRVPLGPVNNSTQDQRKRGEANAQCRDEVGNPCARVEVSTAEPCDDHFRDASTALPHTSAQLIVGVIHATATFLVKFRTKRAREVPILLVDPKRAKTLTGTPSGLSTTVSGEGTSFEEADVCEGGNSRPIPQPLAIAFQPPPTSAWIARVLEPVYGTGLGSLSTSSLGVLLETLVRELGMGRIPPDISKGDAGGFHLDVCESYEVSLLVATLGHAPALVARMAEPPCLMASSSSVDPIERLGRSLAVLDGLKLLLDEVPQRHSGKPGMFATVVLSHYTAALLSMSKDGHAIHALPGGRPWSDVTTFVHACIRNSAPQELRQLPAALRLAAKEVDPLLKQCLG